MPEEVFNELISEMNRLNFTFIIGAGASMGSGIPKGDETARRWLMHLIEMTPAPFNDSYLNKLYNFVKTKGLESATLERISNLFSSKEVLRICNSEKLPHCTWMTIAKILCNGINKSYFEIASVLAQDRADLLRDVLCESMQGKIASSGYLLLAEIMQTTMPHTKHNIVITTNFDDLIPQAMHRIYNERSLSPVIFSHSTLANQLSNINICMQPILFKVHHDLFFDPMNTTRQVAYYTPKVQDALTTLIVNRSLLVIGYSGANDGLMEHIIYFEKPLKIYWAYYDKEPETEKYIYLKECTNHTIKSFKAGDFDDFMKSLSKSLVNSIQRPDTTSDIMHEPIGKIMGESTLSDLRLTARDELGLKKFKEEYSDDKRIF